MHIFEYPLKNKGAILALGAESAGNFCAFYNGKIYFSEDFSDLLDKNNFEKYKKAVLGFLRKNKVKPDIILTDLHPLYKTTGWGAELAKKYGAKHIRIQHHIAHIFSAIGDNIIHNTLYKIPNTFYGIALDGTGYGLDGKIWGGEIFLIQKSKIKNQNDKSKFKIERIGKLENHIMIGWDLAIREPARMLLSILNRFMDKISLCGHMERFYNHNEFELLYNQLQNNFNCAETSSTGRILDAVSVLLGFSKNERNYKHEPIDLLEKNSTKPYADLEPKIIYAKKEELYILQTTPLFEYLIKNLRKDRKRLAATAQIYIAEGLYKISSQFTVDSSQLFIGGGLSNNKIISSYFESREFYTNKTVPRGDAGLSFGQVIYFLANPRNQLAFWHFNRPQTS